MQGSLAAGGQGEEPVGRVVVAVQPPSRAGQERAEPGLGERLVGVERAVGAGGQRGASRRGEEGQPAAGPGDAGEARQAGGRVGQVGYEAGGEDPVKNDVREGQATGLGEDLNGVPRPARGRGDGPVTAKNNTKQTRGTVT